MVVTARQKGQMLPGWVDGAVKHKVPLKTSGRRGQLTRVKGVRRAGERYSNHDLEPEDGGRATECWAGCDGNRGWVLA